MKNKTLSFLQHWQLNAVYRIDRGAVQEPVHYPEELSSQSVERCQYWLSQNKTSRLVLEAQHSLQTRLRVGLGMFLALMFLAGITMVNATLGESRQVIQLPYLLLITIGINLLALAIWAALFFSGRTKQNSRSTVKIRFASWFATAFSMGDKVYAPVADAYFQTLIEHRMAKLLISLVTHTAWLAYLAGVFLAVTLNMSVKAYWFVWETTILSTDTLVGLYHAINAGISWTGLSFELQNLIVGENKIDHLYAGRWLLAAIFIYALLPRVAVGVGTYIVHRQKKVRGLVWPTKSATYAWFCDHQMSQSSVVDRDTEIVENKKQTRQPIRGHGQVCFALEDKVSELAPQGMKNLGVVSSRKVLEALGKENDAPWATSLVQISTALSPDRGNLAVLEALTSMSQKVQYELIPQDGFYATVWRQCLSEQIRFASLEEVNHGES